jgi:hypothetical protein
MPREKSGSTMSSQHFRIFISSPSDVFAERERIERVIARLNGEFGGGLLEAIRWERSYYTAAKTFQDQIPLPSETDLVVCILWKRLGFELPPDYRRADGTTPTGTEYEFEDAMQAARARGSPDVLVYRKAARVLLDAEQVETEQAQFEALKHFWTRWFRTEAGHFTAAYQSFETTDQFETEVEEHIRQWLERHKVVSAGVTWPIELRGSPFRGLQPFDADYAEVFFGRRRVIERARERLADAAKRGTAFLLILGTSGSGKSSLARAGLVPRLTQPGAVPGVDVWRSGVMRPSEGDTPLHALARALYRAGAVPELAEGDNPTPGDLAALLAGAPDAAARAVRLALSRGTAAVAAREGFDRPVEARLLLLVDQFEEALAPPDLRDGFARALAALVATGVVWIVATLRSDLYAPFQASAPLLVLREGGAQLDLLPPALPELSEIVTGPAAAAGLRFDARPDGTGLDEELTAAADQPGALPLLQLALDTLFEARDPAANLLTFAAYDALGGLSGVVERRAEAAMAAIDPAAGGALPGVLRALVDVTGEGVVTGRPAPTRQIAPTPEAVRLVDTFIAARLLVADTRDGETSIRVAHDALLTGWPRAAALIAADREMLRTRGRVETAARRWVQEAQDADFLLPPGRPLAEAVEVAALRPDSLDPTSTEYIRASQVADAARQATATAHAQRELRLEAEAQQARADAATKVVRRTRVAAAIVSVLLLAAAGAAVFANAQRQRAQEQTAEAEHNFKAALDGGASLVDAVNAHLRDGGMTRRVAQLLLGTASDTLGGLVQNGGASVLPPSLQDTRGHLEASFANVQLALCDSVGARARAGDAVAIAEAVAIQAPTDARRLALVLALDALGQAARGDGDPKGAMAAYRRAEDIATRQPAPAGALWTVRRDMATALLDLGERDAALSLLRDDLAWQQQAEAHPDDSAALALAAFDLRRIGFAALGRDDMAAAGEALDREEAMLRRLATLQPVNLEWQRALSINAHQQSRVLSARRDGSAALAKAREAVDLAGSVLVHDPDNAEWQRDLVFANIGLAGMLARSGDLPATVRVLRPAIEQVKSLTGPDSSSRLCKGDAARLHAMAGNALMLTGDSAAAVTELAAGLAIAKGIAAAAPDDVESLHDVVDAEMSLAQIYALANDNDHAAEHDRAGIGAAQRLLARDGGKPEWRTELAALRVHLGDVLRKSGDLPGALAAYTDDREASEQLAAAEPDAPQWQHEIVISLQGIAAVRLLAGKPELQWAALQAALSSAERLVSRQSGNAEWRRSLLEVREAVAAAELGRSEFAAALAHFQAALALADTLVEQDPTETRWRIEQAIALNYVGLAYKFNEQPEAAQDFLDRSKAAFAAAQKRPGAAAP